MFEGCNEVHRRLWKFEGKGCPRSSTPTSACSRAAGAPGGPSSETTMHRDKVTPSARSPHRLPAELGDVNTQQHAQPGQYTYLQMKRRGFSTRERGPQNESEIRVGPSRPRSEDVFLRPLHALRSQLHTPVASSSQPGFLGGLSQGQELQPRGLLSPVCSRRLILN